MQAPSVSGWSRGRCEVAPRGNPRPAEVSGGGLSKASAFRREYLFVQSTTERGGAETILMNLFDANEALRRRSLVATLGYGNGLVPAQLRALGVEVDETAAGRLRNPLWAIRTVRGLARLARKRGVRVIIGNGAHPQVLAGWAARLAGAKSVYYVNMIFDAPARKNHPIDALALVGPCDLFLANSRAAGEALRQIRPRVPWQLVYPGTRVGLVDGRVREAQRNALGVAQNEILYGVFGRLQRWKGQDVFVDAAARVAAEIPRSRFAVVGGSVFGLEPEYAWELKWQVERLGLARRFIFTGFRHDAIELMAACDVVCHTTRVPEPFGMVVIEAMGQARPVIATKGGGPSEIVEDRVSGWLVEPGSDEAIAAAMRELGRDPTLRRRLGEEAQRRIERSFSSTRMAERLLECLSQV